MLASNRWQHCRCPPNFNPHHNIVLVYALTVTHSLSAADQDIKGWGGTGTGITLARVCDERGERVHYKAVQGNTEGKSGDGELTVVTRATERRPRQACWRRSARGPDCPHTGELGRRRERGQASSKQPGQERGKQAVGMLLYSPFGLLCTDWFIMSQSLLIYTLARPCTYGAHLLSLSTPPPHSNFTTPPFVLP
ncbi:hypothetical protein E2C01_056199 [Portunus trituberculatus]|uniref:Uncharacterized protein n=1 Tax=Portunus trituberculatus TaxID=210409 RepID=A0A5B7GWX9_PORTR|nr:hypothetical protein [Portunus trituberculatus]